MKIKSMEDLQISHESPKFSEVERDDARPGVEAGQIL